MNPNFPKPSRPSFTGYLRDAEKVVRARSDVSSTEFRVFSAVMSGLNEKSHTFDCSDEVMAVIAGFRQRQSLSKARAGLQSKRILWFRPGRPGRLTRYGLALTQQDIEDGIAMLNDAKDEARAKIRDDSERRVGVKNRMRGAGNRARPDTSSEFLRKESFTPISSSACESVYAAASTIVYTVHPRHTPSLSTSTDRRLDSERAREVDLPDIEPIDFGDVYRSLGNGDDVLGASRVVLLRERWPQLRQQIEDLGIDGAWEHIQDAIDLAITLESKALNEASP